MTLLGQRLPPGVLAGYSRVPMLPPACMRLISGETHRAMLGTSQVECH